ncbi:MAG: hypothetical protein HZA61_17060 [Candidatus Eisenbacteria bacterium]|uniref:Tetratricopeptide repeat protein n=1 Tax=Eiseniibacteriota bacterium TaxID=2212470 RepID=A0A933SF00_UNCEI|nr:hypothetical protein [Candidatus Eisenbacteria bacterium]
MWQRVREYLRELLRALIGQPAGTWAATQNATQRAAELLAQALGEDDPARRVTLLREALAAGERLGGESGDIVVMEASLHLGERLRAAGERAQAIAHFTRAVERSFRVGDPVGRQRRAGVLSRLGILDQEAGDLVSARSRYEESLRIGSDTDSALLLGMLTQAAFNLGLIQNSNGDDDGAQRSWSRAMLLGMRAGHPSGWDPAAIAAFNLGHLYERRGDHARARETLLQVGRIAEPGGTPVGLMASAKAAMALASLAEGEGLPGEVEAAGQFARACELGRASRTAEGSLVAVQSALALAEHAAVAGRSDEARRRLEQAIEWSASCERADVARYVVLAHMRLGQVLAESGEPAAAAERLADAYARGRESTEPWVREIAAQSACSLHRTLCALGRWAEARTLAEDAVAFAGGLDSAMGRGLAAAAAYAQAFQKLHDGDQPGARALLAAVADQGLASGAEVGERVAIDALLLAGHLDRQAKRLPEALAQFQRAARTLRDHDGAESAGLSAMASLNTGHVLLALERELEARYAYEKSLEFGRLSGTSTGRAAAANAALNLASMLEDEVDEAKRREWFGVAIALGKSSRTALGADVARNAEKGLARLDGEGGAER